MQEAVDNILLDLGGVILDIDPQRAVEAFKALGFENAEKDISPWHHTGIFRDFECGDIDEESFVAWARKHTNKNVADEEIVKAWSSILVALPEERIRLLEKICRDYRLMILSNTNPVHARIFHEMEAACTKIEELFDQRFYSFELGCCKPEEAIYKRVIDDGNVAPERTLFLDDSEANIKAARKLGFQTALVTQEKGMCQILSEKIFQ